MKFKLVSKFKPTGDQPEAIKKLTQGIKGNKKYQTLLGVTGSGKTFTLANIIEEAQKPVLLISHNKTLAAQLYSEFRNFFPKNAAHYFVSYYDYYQPEAYLPTTDTYIEKETNINEEIDRLRHAATQSLMARKDVIVVASVSCIFGLGPPDLYEKVKISLKVGQTKNLKSLLKQLISIQYKRSDYDLRRGIFRVRGDVLEIFPAYGENTIRIEFFGNEIEKISKISALTGEIIQKAKKIEIYPATHYITNKDVQNLAINEIKEDLTKQAKALKKQSKLLEAQRLAQRTNFDLEMIKETGYCTGIENYSRYFDRRKSGEPPYTLIDFYPEDFLIIIDESHMTIPQLRAMYNQDKARKETLIQYGFRLPSALDNRPLNFKEFEKKINQAIFVSATPTLYELKKSGKPIEQIIRPTGLIDPKIGVRKTEGQIQDLISEITKRTKAKQRVLVTTLTKRLAEELTDFLADKGIKVTYLHHEIDTLERPQILRDLRLGVYDVIVGINLLREGLDLPEVSLVAILDADKEGFLRSDWSLIQVAGRAARHVEGKVIMYADKMTRSMKIAINETARRRKLQIEYNKKHGITPRSIKKAIAEGEFAPKAEKEKVLNLAQIPKDELKRLIWQLESQMQLAAKSLQFEKAAELRDQIVELKKAKYKGKVKIKELFN